MSTLQADTCTWALDGQSEKCLLDSSFVQSHFYFVLENKGSQRICAAFCLLLLRISYATRRDYFFLPTHPRGIKCRELSARMALWLGDVPLFLRFATPWCKGHLPDHHAPLKFQSDEFWREHQQPKRICFPNRASSGCCYSVPVEGTSFSITKKPPDCCDF
jgi:hypothetical protein